jgi:cytochrome c-type biogenesis protein CcmH/NrfG
MRRLHGDLLAAARRWSDAVQAYDRALALDPDDEPSKAGRARALAQLGR